MVPNILTTKLQVPRLCQTYTARPRLLHQIEVGLPHLLTLISAPAGFGKTMLLADWAKHQPHPVSWLSLDASENQPAIFWQYVIAALELALPGFSATYGPSVNDGADPPITVLLTVLINKIVQLPFTQFIIFDNYHVIENAAIHQQVAFLLENCPANLHLFIVGRTEPPLALPRLRARSQVSEIRSEHLRFQGEETRHFFTTIYGLRLSDDELAMLHAATEGWVDGLHMVASWLRHLHPDQLPPIFAAIAVNNRYVEEYLLVEIFDQQSAPRQCFLLYSSILETLTGPLCRAVTGAEQAQKLLEELEEENLFITALDPMRDRYRYHSMFGDFLRHRLAQTQPELLPELHRRASLWYEEQGLLSEAISHAFAGRDWARALRLTEFTAEVMIQQERFASVQKYLEQQPDQLAGRGVESQQIASILAGNPLVQHNLNALVLGQIYLELGHANEAAKLLSGINLADPAFNDTQAKFSLITALLEARLEQGKLRLAAATCQPFLSLALAQPQNPLWFRFYQCLAALYYEWNQCEKAEWFSAHCLQPMPAHAVNQLWAGIGLLDHATICATLGKADAASAAHTQALALAQTGENPHLSAYLQAYQSRLWLQQGKIELVRQWFDHCGLQLDEAVPYRRQFEYLTLVRAAIAIGHARSSLAFLAQRLLVAEATGRGHDIIEVLILQALAYQALGEPKSAFTAIANALCLAEPEGYVRLFIDEGRPMRTLLTTAAARGVTLIYVQNLLTAFAPFFPPACPLPSYSLLSKATADGLVEPLTERELAVLRLVAAGHSNREVGTQLAISPTTVKKHLGNVLGKLAAKNRTEAAARARALHLL